MAAKAIAAGFLLLGVASWAMGQTTAPASLADQYQEMVRKSDANSADDHYKLGEWAYKNNLNEVAVKELKAALALDPAHVKASILIKDAQSRLGKPATETQPAGGGVKDANGISTAIPKDWLVPEEDIYRIRLEELRADDKVAITFRADKSGVSVIERFIRKWRGKEEFKRFGFDDEFRGIAQAQPAKAVAFMREKDPDDTDIKDDILVKEDPKFMTDFRSKVWPIVASSCASASCHGAGELKGGLRLFNVAGRNDRLDYANYLILDGLVSKGRRMIERSNPDQSLLTQYMLTDDLAQFRHPTVISPPPVGRRDEAKFKVVLEWIKSLHAPPHPDYRLKYKAPLGMNLVFKTELPVPTPTTSPATTKP